MKILILIPLIFFTGSIVKSSTPYFYVQKVNTIDAGVRNAYKIKELGDSSDLGNSYPIFLRKHYSIADTLSMIEELLKFEGDARHCVVPIRCYNPAISQLYTRKEEHYSLQLEALFMINQLYFKEPFKFSPFPVLIDQNTREYSTVSGHILKLAYNSYRVWFKKVRKEGLDRARNENLEPLTETSIAWWR